MTSASERRARKRQRKEMKTAKESPAPLAKSPKMDATILGAPATVESFGAMTPIIQINRLPEGFFEDQLADFFHQFGTVTATRVWRNARSGGSKGVAWVRFDVVRVAQIAAETMHNYLCFGKIMKCRVLYKKQVPRGLFDKRFERPIEKDWTAVKYVKIVNAVKSAKVPLIGCSTTINIVPLQTLRNNGKRAGKRENARDARLAALGVAMPGKVLADEKKPDDDDEPARTPLESFQTTAGDTSTMTEQSGGDDFSLLIDSDDSDVSFASLPHTVRKRKTDKTPARVVDKRATPSTGKSSGKKSAKKTPSSAATPAPKVKRTISKRRL